MFKPSLPSFLPSHARFLLQMNTLVLKVSLVCQGWYPPTSCSAISSLKSLLARIPALAWLPRALKACHPRRTSLMGLCRLTIVGFISRPTTCVRRSTEMITRLFFIIAIVRDTRKKRAAPGEYMAYSHVKVLGCEAALGQSQRYDSESKSTLIMDVGRP